MIDVQGWVGIEEAVDAWTNQLSQPGMRAYSLVERVQRPGPGGRVLQSDETISTGSATDVYPQGIKGHLLGAVLAHLGDAETDCRPRVKVSLRYGDSDKRGAYLGTLTRDIVNPSPAAIMATDGVPQAPAYTHPPSAVSDVGGIVAPIVAGGYDAVSQAMSVMERAQGLIFANFERTQKLQMNVCDMFERLGERLGAMGSPEVALREHEYRMAQLAREEEREERDGQMASQLMPLLAAQLQQKP